MLAMYNTVKSVLGNRAARPKIVRGFKCAFYPGLQTNPRKAIDPCREGTPSF
jgi:hypothetical protein